MEDEGDTQEDKWIRENKVDRKSGKMSMLAKLQAYRCNKGQSTSNNSSGFGGGTSLKKLQRVEPRKHGETSKTSEKTCVPLTVQERSIDSSFTPLPILIDSDEISSQFSNSTLESCLFEGDMNSTIGSETDSESGAIIKKEESTHIANKNVIRPIDRNVVHQICSGQVIVTLSTAVKELIENSLDAGSTKIDIRLIEHGSKLIEVSDNGNGITEANFEGLALKHHTSKLSEFGDLENLTTFGFRGEALSSLCALSNLSVTTRHKKSNQKTGHKIEYSNSGRIVSQTRCAREYGTTITLKDLFHTLPVRHREFQKNLKREFHRMITVLYGYCVIIDGVRLTCTNQIGSGTSANVVSVPAYHSMKERIVAVFGSKQFTSLIKIKQSEHVPEEVLNEYGLAEEIMERKYEIEGYISQPNQGRSSSDRQFYFINSRPCDYTKISRMVNEVYHTFSRNQNPFVCLHIKTDRENVDVNVTPDKRTLYIQNEKILLAILKAALLPLLSTAASTFTSSQSLSQSQLNFAGTSQKDVKVDNSYISSGTFEIEQSQDESDRQSGFSRQFSTPGTNKLPRSVIDHTDNFLKKFKKDSPSLASHKRFRDSDSVVGSDKTKLPKLTGYLDKYSTPEKQNLNNKVSLMQTRRFRSKESDDEDIEEITDEPFYDRYSLNESINSDTSRSLDIGEDAEDIQIMYDDDFSESSQEIINNGAGSQQIKVDWKEVSNFYTKPNNASTTFPVSYVSRFRAKISPEDNSTAEEELKKQLSKDMFSKMEIHGQFNLGFIIVSSGPDLFIVDQHASDEKFNFEDLEKTMVLQGQPLIRPLDLELPAISENIIMDNIKAFQKNGFDFIISTDDEITKSTRIVSEKPTKRVKLSKIPFSKNTEFGKSDVEELVFLMEDASEDSFYRPTKVREMLASRACRKSVMIGTSLSTKEMRSIVDHMGEMEQPWNCPHGRPTIRHLINLKLLPDWDNVQFNH